MKLDQIKENKRLVIFFFNDADGVVDRYVSYMLEDMKKNCRELFVVCNGKLTPEGRDVFRKVTPNILVRENKGFDVWAYKAVLEYYGWEALQAYDEVVLMNSTIMGPVYPFAEMFKEMDQRDVDFWGITKFHKDEYNSLGCECGYTPEHIQSHFIAVRRSMLQSPEFKKYWDKMPSITSYEEAVRQHEAVFTQLFSDAGFRWDVFVNTDDLDGFTNHPLLIEPMRLLRDYRCPIFKRNSFCQDYHVFLVSSSGNQGKELLRYLKEETDYDTGMVWESILRTNNMADIKDCLNLNYILPQDHAIAETSQKKVALVIHSYFEDLIDYCYQYALSMPETSDIYITVGSEKKKALVEECFSKGPWNKVTVILIENRGRDVGALLVGVAEYLDAYDYVCFMHDKKVTQMDAGIKGYVFSERCFQNLLGSKELVTNILALFDKEPYLGMLCPPPPNHADYYPTLGFEWGPNFDIVKKLAKKLEISCSIDPGKEPVAPLGTMFWFRARGLKALIDYGWKYGDFPKEPIQTDGTVLHAIERIYPYVIQDAGYFCGWVLNDDYARTEWNNLSFMLRNVNIRAMGAYGFNNHHGLVTTMDYCMHQNNLPAEMSAHLSKRILFKRRMKRKIPKPIWAIMRKIYHLFGGEKWIG